MVDKGFKATKIKLSDYEIKTTLGTGKTTFSAKF